MLRRTLGGASSRILEVATQLFAERGYRDTTIQDIASAAEIGRSSVFWHFSSKEGVLQAVNEQLMRSWQENILEAGRQYHGLVAAKALISVHTQYFETQPTLARLAAVLYGELYSPDSEIARMFCELEGELRKALAGWLSEARESGEIRSDVDADRVALLIGSAMAGMGKEWSMNPSYNIVQAHMAILQLLDQL